MVALSDDDALLLVEFPGGRRNASKDLLDERFVVSGRDHQRCGASVDNGIEGIVFPGDVVRKLGPSVAIDGLGIANGDTLAEGSPEEVLLDELDVFDLRIRLDIIRKWFA